MARERAPGHGARRRRVLQRQALPFALRGRARDHGQSLVGATLLRAEGARYGEQPWNALKLRPAVARSTRANLPKKDWSKTSTRSTHSARPAKRSSRVRPARAGAS